MFQSAKYLWCTTLLSYTLVLTSHWNVTAHYYLHSFKSVLVIAPHWNNETFSFSVNCEVNKAGFLLPTCLTPERWILDEARRAVDPSRAILTHQNEVDGVQCQYCSLKNEGTHAFNPLFRFSSLVSPVPVLGRWNIALTMGWLLDEFFHLRKYVTDKLDPVFSTQKNWIEDSIIISFRIPSYPFARE